MLDELHIHDLALIDDLSVSFSPGLTVLTGETGAGKSMIVNATTLLRGARADSTMVREGADHLRVDGRFFTGDDELVVSRRVGSDGRSRCTVDGSMATVTELGEKVGPLVELAGQHEHQRLLDPKTHVGLLDAWAGERVSGVLAEYEDAYRAAQDAREELRRVEEGVDADRERLEAARDLVRIIDGVDPQEGEYEELLEKMPRLEHGEALTRISEGAYEALSGDDAILAALGSIMDELERARALDPVFAEHVAAARDAQSILGDLSYELRDYADGIEFDPDALDRANQRLADLSRLMRNLGPQISDVLARREEAARLISLVDDHDLVLAEARRTWGLREEELTVAAAALTDARKDAAAVFSTSLAEAIHRLEMEKAGISIGFEDLPRERWTVVGPHRVEFLYSPSIGMEARPLARIASGGEISRVMFAVLDVMGGADDVETIVFDEIDAGVGGTAARALGERMAELARNHQIIVVTHLAQIAAFADRHLVVSRSHGDGGVTTDIDEVTGDDRVLEIARMLSGDTSDASREHARELLERARG